MDRESRRQHWDAVYTRKRDDEVSWFEAEPALSLELIGRCGLPSAAPILDVGGGSSRLVDGLLARGCEDVSVLDVSDAALSRARARLGPAAERVRWIVSDVTTFAPSRTYAVWHDRAVLHFLLTPAERLAYQHALEAAVMSGGHAIIGTFAPTGPERCSDLVVQRYDAASLAAAFKDSFELIDALQHEHLTPGGKVQPFAFVRLVRK